MQDSMAGAHSAALRMWHLRMKLVEGEIYGS